MFFCVMLYFLYEIFFIWYKWMTEWWWIFYGFGWDNNIIIIIIVFIEFIDNIINIIIIIIIVIIVISLECEDELWRWQFCKKVFFYFSFILFSFLFFLRFCNRKIWKQKLTDCFFIIKKYKKNLPPKEKRNKINC